MVAVRRLLLHRHHHLNHHPPPNQTATLAYPVVQQGRSKAQHVPVQAARLALQYVVWSLTR